MGNRTTPRRGNGMIMRGRLLKAGDWVTDGAFAAHKTLPTLGALHGFLPVLPGTYELTAEGPKWVKVDEKTTGRLREFLDAPLEECWFVSKDDQPLYDIDSQMPPEAGWWINTTTAMYLFDGRIAGTAVATSPEGWWWKICTAFSVPMLAGGIGPDTLFLLAAIATPDLEEPAGGDAA